MQSTVSPALAAGFRREKFTMFIRTMEKERTDKVTSGKSDAHSLT